MAKGLSKGGPAIKPLFMLSLMVMVSTGPGIRAPDSAMIKDDINMAVSFSKFQFFSVYF